jgi:hypothetical protein
MNHVVIRLRGEGAVLVRCMWRINLASPYFHSMSDCACAEKKIGQKMVFWFFFQIGIILMELAYLNALICIRHHGNEKVDEHDD